MTNIIRQLEWIKSELENIVAETTDEGVDVYGDIYSLIDKVGNKIETEKAIAKNMGRG